MKSSFWGGLDSKIVGRSVSPNTISNRFPANPPERPADQGGRENVQVNVPKADPRIARLANSQKPPITKAQSQVGSLNKSPQRSTITNAFNNSSKQAPPQLSQNENSGGGDFEFMMPSAPVAQFQAPKPKGLSYESELKSLPGLNNRNLHQRNKPDVVPIIPPPVAPPAPVIPPRPVEKPAFLKAAEVSPPKPPQQQNPQPPPLVRTGISPIRPSTPHRAPSQLHSRPQTPTLGRPLSPMRTNQPFGGSGFQPVPSQTHGAATPRRSVNTQVALKPATPLLGPPTPLPVRPAASPSPVRSPILETLVTGDKPQQKPSGKTSPWKAAAEQQKVPEGFSLSSNNPLNQTFNAGHKRPADYNLGKRALTPERSTQSGGQWGSKSPVKHTPVRCQSPIAQLVGGRQNQSANKGDGWKRGHSPTPYISDSSPKPQYQNNKFSNKKDPREGKASVGSVWKPSSGPSAANTITENKPAAGNTGLIELRSGFSASSRAVVNDAPPELMEFVGSAVSISIADFPPLPPLDPLPKFVMSPEESLLPLLILQSPGNQVREGTVVHLATSFNGPSTISLSRAVHPFYPIEMIMRVNLDWATEFLEKWAVKTGEDLEETARQFEAIINMVAQPEHGTPIDEEEII